MRAKRSIIAALVAAASLTAMAAPAIAEEPPPEPESPPSNGGVTFHSDDGLLPICLNVVRVTVFGTTLVNLPKTCIG